MVIPDLDASEVGDEQTQELLDTCVKETGVSKGVSEFTSAKREATKEERESKKAAKDQVDEEVSNILDAPPEEFEARVNALRKAKSELRGAESDLEDARKEQGKITELRRAKRHLGEQREELSEEIVADNTDYDGVPAISNEEAEESSEIPTEKEE